MRHAPSPFQLVVFDLGGTTIEATVDVARVFQEALRTHGVAIDADELAAWRGATKREVINALLRDRAQGNHDPAAVYRTFQKTLITAFEQRGVTTVPGVAAALETLRRQDIFVAINTGFDRRVTESIMRQIPWTATIDALVTGDDVSSGRPEPDMIVRAMSETGIDDPARVVVVGDTANDIEAGRRAGAGARLGVLSGAHDRARLAAADPTAILRSAADVPEWLMSGETEPNPTGVHARSVRED